MRALLKVSETFDWETFEMHKGFGKDKNYYKICSFEGSYDGIVVVDKNPKVAQYWIDKFLGVAPQNTGKKNTETLTQLLQNNELYSDAIKNQENFEEVLSKTGDFLFSHDRIDKSELMDFLNSENLIDEKDESEVFSEKSNDMDSTFDKDRKTLNNFYHRTLQVSDTVKIEADRFDTLKRDELIDFTEDTIILKHIDKDNIEKIKEQLKWEND